MVPRYLLDEIQKKRPEVARGQDNDRTDFTGERFLPGYADGSVELQHVHRYSFALPFVLGRNVLDIACGEGYGSHLMSQVANQIIGVDIDDQVIQTARKRYPTQNLTFETGSAAYVPVETGFADVVVSFETIEHLTDQRSFWSEIKRILRSDGILIISSPDRTAYNQQRTEKNAFHKRELSQEDLTEELSRRFKHHALFTQSIVFGSQITPASESATSQTTISVNPDTGVLNWESGQNSKPPILIAVASDKVFFLPEPSLYTGIYPPDAMASLVGGIAERDRTIRDLQQKVSTLEGGLSATSTEALEKERDRAILQASRIKETLAEQDRTIRALTKIVSEYRLGIEVSDSGIASPALVSKA